MDKLIAGASSLGLELGSRQLEQFETYYRDLVVWNRWMNLTAITGYEEVQTRHFLDALTVALAWNKPLNAPVRVIDVGTGAGIPGIPLRIVLPEIRLVLLDSVRKKAAFLEHIIQRLGIEDVGVVVGRAEEIARREGYREGFDIALSRALAGMPALVELTLPFCRVGGRLIAQKKGEIWAEVDSADRAIGLLGGRLADVERIELPGLEDDRQLVVIDKVSPTPLSYPRRPGLPAKRPIL